MKTETEKEISLLSGLREREEERGRAGEGGGLRRRRDKERGGEWREKRSDFGKIRSNLCTRASI